MVEEGARPTAATLCGIVALHVGKRAVCILHHDHDGLHNFQLAETLLDVIHNPLYEAGFQAGLLIGREQR